MRRGAARRAAARRRKPAREVEAGRVGYAPLCSSSIFPATNRTHPFIASIARADFSVCVRTSIRPLAPRRFMHPPDDSLSPPCRAVTSLPLSLPIPPAPAGIPFPRPYPFVEATLAAAAAAASVLCIFDRRCDSTRETRRGSRREEGRPRDRVRRLLDLCLLIFGDVDGRCPYFKAFLS